MCNKYLKLFFEISVLMILELKIKYCRCLNNKGNSNRWWVVWNDLVV